MLILSDWKPSLRTCVFQDRPDWVPDEVYKEALAAKRHYNAAWEFWVYMVSKDYNCSMALAEDACIRGIKKEMLRIKHIYGDALGKWYEEFLEMGDIFNKVKYADYVMQLGDINGTEHQHDGAGPK